jgi:hypothetical protein
MAWYAASQVPHLVEWLALCQNDDDADQAKGDEKVDGAFAEPFKRFGHSYQWVSVNCTQQ